MIEEIAERAIGELNRLRVVEMDRARLASVKRGVEEIREIARRFDERQRQIERTSIDEISAEQIDKAAKKRKGKQ